MNFEEPGSRDSQTNFVLCSDNDLIITAHEDKNIRVFDVKSGKMIRCSVAHTDSVTSLCTNPAQDVLYSVGHDGSMRSWDMRKFQCINELPGHRKKFDESIHSIAHHPTENFFATAGADGIVKLFED